MAESKPEVEISFERNAMSSNVGSDTGRSVVVENMEVAFGTALLSYSVQKLFSLPV
jgi:hypothetical protein